MTLFWQNLGLRKIMKKFLFILFLIFFSPSFANAECLKVGDDPEIAISDANLQSLAQISYGREQIFEALKRTSAFETMGCWATPVGNFDAQTLSVGVLQWNYGQNSLQDLMARYKASFATPEEFVANIKETMPIYGEQVFADDCLIAPFAQTCKDKLLAAQPENKLNADIQKEYETLFNSLRMRQIQTDKFTEFLIDMAPKLNLLFGNAPTQTQVEWGMDVAIQQGYIKYGDNQLAFINPDDVKNVRKLYENLTPAQKKFRTMSIIRWYSGLCGSIYQGVNDTTCNFNIKNWCAVANHGLTDEQFDLFNLTFIRSRIAQGQSGRWQANAFSRRAKLVLKVGKVGPEELLPPKGVKKTKKCDAWMMPTK